jgi:2'-5' RNA ligase
VGTGRAASRFAGTGSTDAARDDATVRRAIVLFVSGTVCVELDDIRNRWDPLMCARIGAHITLVHDVNEPARAAEVVAAAAASTGPFTVRLGPSATWGKAAWGVYLHVDDPTGTVTSLQAQLASLEDPRWARVPYRAHVTLVHSRTTPAAVAEEAWAALDGFEPAWEVEVEAIDVVELAEPAWRTVERYSLSPLVVAD